MFKTRFYPILIGILGFILTMAVIQVARNRSFWGDEAAVMDSLMSRTPRSILVDGPLAHAQQFPKVYLALIGVIAKAFGYTTFIARLGPLLFGLGAFGVWLWLFVERYSKPTQWIPCFVACGMLVVSSYPLAYMYEFKQYSAELFFTGLLLALYQTEILSSNNRLKALVAAALASFLFGYATLWVSMAVLGAMLLGHMLSPERGRIHPVALVGCILCIPLLFALSKIDYQSGLQSGVLHDYWASQFVTGSKWIERLRSLHDLFWNFLFKWWLTGWGPMSVKCVPSGAWYVWPGETMQNPDLKNALYGLSLSFIALCLWQWRRLLAQRDVMIPSLGILSAMALLAWLKMYPWGLSRLSLYGMPIAILLIVEGVSLASGLLARLTRRPRLCALLWLPLGWLILRNGTFMMMGFATGRLSEDINPAIRLLDPSQSRYLIVSDTTDLVMRTYERRPATVAVLSQAEMNHEGMPNHLGQGPAYFLWAHGAPRKNAAGVPNDFERYYREADVVYAADPDFGPELLLLKP